MKFQSFVNFPKKIKEIKVFLHSWFLRFCITCCPRHFFFGLHVLYRNLMFDYIHTHIMLKDVTFEKHIWIHTSEIRKTLILKFHPGCLHVFFSFFHPGMKFHLGKHMQRHFTIDRDDFIPGRVSSRYEMSRINTLLPCVEILVFNKDSYYEPATSVKWFSEQVTSRNALSNKLCQKVNLTWV